MSKLSGIFSLRNFVKKQLMETNKSGIIKFPDKGKVDFGEMMIREELFLRGIDPTLIKDEKVLEGILNTPIVKPKVAPKKPGEVIEVDFDKGRWKDTEPEKFFYGGFVEQPELGQTAHGSEALASRTRLAAPGSTSTTSTGLNYLLAEDNDNQRVPFLKGKIVKGGNWLLKTLSGTREAIKNSKDYSPEQIKLFLNQIDNQIKSLEAGGPIPDEVIQTIRKDPKFKSVWQNQKSSDPDLREMEEVLLEYGQKHAEGGITRVPFSKGKGVDLLRRGFMKAAGAGAAGLAALKSGLLGFGEKTAPVVEKAVETVQETPQYFFDLVSKIKMFGKQSKVGPQERVNEFSYTGKNGDEYTLTEDIVTGDARIVKDKIGGVRVADDEVVDGIADRSVMEYKSGKGMADETTGKKTPVDEYDEYKVEFDQDGTEAGADIIDESVQKEIIEEVSEKITKKADGGRAGYVLGGKVGIKILNLLKDKKKVKEAYDNIFPTGDYKYDADMVAESLVENNPKVFGNRLYEDLTDRERMEVYAAGLEEASTNFAKALKMKRAMDKASRPTKTLKGIEETGTIDISDDAVAEEFATFMKETDPVGHAKIQKVVDDANQQLELKRFKTKGRKKNASGGLANMLGE